MTVPFMEFWTNMRFMTYPVIFVAGLICTYYFYRWARAWKLAVLVLSTCLSLSISLWGLSNFVGLLISYKTDQSYSSTTSFFATTGVLLTGLVLVIGAVYMTFTTYNAASHSSSIEDPIDHA